MLRQRLAGTLAAVLFLGSSLLGQDGQPVFSAESELVVLHVHVRDERGAYVKGLPQDAFAVVADGRAQEVKFFTGADEPVSLALVIDSSGSMLPRRKMVVAAAQAFVELSNADDELVVLTFNEEVRLTWGPRVIGSEPATAIAGAVQRDIRARGKTAIYDAVARGLDRLAGGVHRRSVLVVISDGGDNASRHVAREALREKVERSDAMIYTVAVRDPVTRDGDPEFLRELSRSTGGESFEPGDPDDLPAVLQRIARDIRAVYTMGFVPVEGQPSEESLRRVRVVVEAPDGGKLDVRTRAGFRGGGE